MIPPLSCAKKALRILQVFSDDRAELGGTQIDKLVMSHKCSVYPNPHDPDGRGFCEAPRPKGRSSRGTCRSKRILATLRMSRERIKELRGQVFEVKLPAHRAGLREMKV